MVSSLYVLNFDPDLFLAGEKKKLSRRSPLQRTKSANPEDLSKTPLTFSFGAPNTKENDEKFREYNKKLTESRLRMEQDRDTDKTKLSSPRSMEKRELQRSKTTGDQTGRSSPRFMELRQEGMRSPRGASPVNLSVPGNTEKTEGSQKFLSGHLLLAKKLSDEANESDKMKKKGKSKGTDDASSSNTMSPLAYSLSKQTQNVEPGGKKQLQHKEKQSVSRQVSLQGSEDARLVQGQGHMGLHASQSFDLRRLASHQTYIHGNQDDRQTLMQDFQQVQHQEFGGSFYGPIEPPHRHLSNKDMSHGHASVTRMQSAPDPFTRSKPSVRPPLMMRQNSSSDTQLNKFYTGEHDMFGGDMLTRGSSDNMPKVMQDTTGSVKFQIGSVPPMQTYKPPAFHNTLYSHNSTPDFRSQQQQFSTEFQQQQGQPFMSMQHQVQNNLQQTPQPNVSSVFPTTQFADQPGNIWEPNHPNTTTFSNQSHFPAGSLWPMMPPTGQGPPLSNFNINPGQSHPMGPNPIENPILPNDRRFKLYHDLCRLFPEEKVRAVMNQHPTADNPNELCAYLINSK